MNEWSDMAIGKLMLYSVPTQTSKLNLARCRFEHTLRLTISFRCFFSSIFHPSKFYPSCNSLQLSNQLKSSPTCMQFVPETQPRMEFDERLAVPVVEDFDFTIYTTEREQSQQYTQRSGWAESAQTRVWIQLENLQHCCGELVSTSYRYSLFYFSAHFLFSRVLKRKSHAQPHRQHMPNRRDSAFLGFSRSLHNLIGPAKYFFLLDDFIFLLLFAHFARVYRYRRRRLREKTI